MYMPCCDSRVSSNVLDTSKVVCPKCNTAYKIASTVYTRVGQSAHGGEIKMRTHTLSKVA